MLVAQAPVDRVRIGDERGIRRVEPELERCHGEGRAGHPASVAQAPAGAGRERLRSGLAARRPVSLGCAPTVGREGRPRPRPERSLVSRPSRTSGPGPGGGHMRIRSTGLTLFVGLSMLVAACSSGRPHRPRPSAAAPSYGPVRGGLDRPRRPRRPRRRRSSPRRTSRSASSPTSARSTTRTSTSSRYAGAGQRCRLDRRQDPDVVVPTTPSDYEPDLQALRRPGLQRHRGGRLQPRRRDRQAGQGQPEHLVHRRRPQTPASTRTATSTPTFTDCSGDLATLIPNYIAINYQEDQAGYLAGHRGGRRSARAASSARSAASRVCGPCVRYIQGYYLGATVGQPGHQDEVSVGLRQRLRQGLRRPGRWHRLRRRSSSSRTPASTSCSRSPA